METTRISKCTPALELLNQIFTQVLDDQSDAAGVPIFVAVDVETSKGKLSEIGFSTFDPCCLPVSPSPPPNDLDSLNSHIVTHYYARDGSKYRYRYKPYRLGKAQQLQNSDLQRIIDTHLQPIIDGTLRKVILVGHAITHDLSFLKTSCNLDLSQVPNVEAILDTQNICRRVLLSTRPPSLKRVLQDLKLDYIGLHNAGHDCRYTLRALLMLLVRFEQSNSQSQSQSSSPSPSQIQNARRRGTFTLIEEIARCHKTNERRTWTIPTKTKLIRVPHLFDQGIEDELGLLDLLN